MIVILIIQKTIVGRGQKRKGISNSNGATVKNPIKFACRILGQQFSRGNPEKGAQRKSDLWILNIAIRLNCNKFCLGSGVPSS